jgi:hypothetical protein
VNQLFLAIGAEVLAEEHPHNTGPDFGKASPFGLLVVVLLVIATLFLVRSMNKQLKKVPESFDRQNPEPDQAADMGTDAADGVSDQTGTDGSPRASGPGDEPG